MFFAREFDRGMHVEIMPGARGWSNHDARGVVIKRTHTYVYVRLGESGRVVRCAPQTLFPEVRRQKVGW